MSDPFNDRIDTLLREGKITTDEADRLRKALNTQGEPLTAGHRTTPPAPPAAPAAPTPTPPVAPAQPTVAAGPARRLYINATAGDIDVTGEPGRREVSAETRGGDIEITRDGDAIRIAATGRATNPTELGWLDTVFKAIGRVMPVNIKLLVPADLDLISVKALAGDVDIRGVQGRAELELQAGDLKLRDATSFDIHTKAGDVKVQTRLERGQSSITALAGDVDVELEPGSDVTLSASNTAGELRTRGFILTQTDKRVVGGSLQGRAGEGRARLDVRLTAGDVEINARSEQP